MKKKMERNFERGQVYYLRDRDSWGHEQSLGRPVIILNAFDDYNDRTVANCMLMTSREKPAGISVNLSSTDRVSWALCNQIMTVDVRRFGTYMCTLNSREMGQIGECLKVVFGLKESEPRVVEEEVFEDIPVEVDEIQAKVESELYQKLYTKAMADLVEARYKLDELQIKYDRIGRGSQPKINEVHRDEGISVDLDKLKKNMQTPNAEMTGEFVEPVGRDDAVPASLGKCSGGKTLTRKEIEKLLIAKGLGDKMRVGAASVNPNAKVTNVNDATLEDFQAIGIGYYTARAIIAYRNKNGFFERFEDLLNVRGFGPGSALVFGPYLEV